MFTRTFRVSLLGAERPFARGGVPAGVLLPKLARYQLRHTSISIELLPKRLACKASRILETCYIPIFFWNGYIIADFFAKVKTNFCFYLCLGRNFCFSPFALRFFVINYIVGIENTQSNHRAIVMGVPVGTSATNMGNNLLGCVSSNSCKVGC